MALSSGSTNQARLLELALDQGLSLEGLPAKLSALSVSPSFASPSDISRATQIFERHKSTKTHGKPFLKTKSRIANYNFKVSTEALKEVVEQNGSAGVAEALFDLGGNIGCVQRERIAQQDAERSALLMTAAARSNSDLVRLLAPKTTQSGRNNALKQAVSARNLDIMQILLEYGADPNHCENSFWQACLAGDEDLVSLFLTAPAPKQLRNSTITINLLGAVNSGSVRTVSLLALSGADCSHGQAAALHRAIELLQPRFVLAILLGVPKPSEQLLDAAVSAAYNFSEAATQVKKIFIETLLCAGAQGIQTAAVLVHCVKRGEIDLVNLLVGHGTSINFNNGQAVSAAVKGGRLDILRLLLGNRPLDRNHASRAFSEIPLPLERDTRYDMMKILINAGACGPPLHEELIRAVRERDDRLIDLILLGQASVDYQDGAALRIAVQNEQIELVSKLMSKNPDENSLRKVFSSIRTCSTKCGRLQLTQIFLRAGIRGKVVDIGLRDAIRDQTDLRDNSLINLLSKGGADANFNQGEGLAFSVDRGDIEIVQSLLLSLTDLSTISAQIPRAMNLRPVLRRYQMLVALIEKLSEQSDAPAEQVHMALVDAIEENPIDVKLLGLLLGKGRADINYDSGEALRKVLKQVDISVVEAMLKLPDGFPPSVLRLETIRSALSTVIDLPPSNLQKLPKLRAIVRKGSEGNTLSDALSKALIWEIERHTVNAVPGSWPSADVLGILLKAGADVNDDSGRSVMLATEAAALPILKILLKHEPNSSVVDAAMSRIMHLTKSDDQLSCSRALLEMGVSDKVIDQVLIEVASKGSTSLQMTQQLLDFGAFPGYENGASIKAAVNARDLTTLRTLLDTKQSPRHLKAVADRQNGINSSLILGAFSSNLGICKLLLKHGASVNYGGSVAAKKTTQVGNAKLLQLLLTAEPSSDTLGICFNAARRLSHDQQYPVLEQILKAGTTGSSVNSNLINGYLIDLVESSDVSKALISLLVDFNASVHYENHRSMRFATLRSSFEIFSIILKAATQRSSFTYCFGEGMRDGIWRSPLGLDKFSLLLDKGACGDPVNEALVEAVRAFGKQSNLILFVDLLLQHSADVDYKNGLALQLACGIGDISLISKLLTNSPAGHTKFLSIAELLNAPVFSRQPECVTVSVISAIMQSPGDHPELNTSHPNHGSILKLSLSRRPGGAEILETLIGYGASVEGVPPISNDNVNDIESSSLLFWALSEPNIEIPIDCISLIVNAGALLDAKSFLTGKTPLILAAERGRYDVLRMLVQHGADVSARDDSVRSPLFYASRRGDCDSVRLLVNSGAKTDDGCLHEAARHLRPNAIKVLLTAGHDPNFPSPIEDHGGRGALGELLLRARATEMNQQQVQETVMALINGGADATIKESGKSLIYLAIDNEDPIPMVKAFIRAYLWKNNGIDQDYNLITIGNYRYSPTTYVEKNQRLRPPPDQEGLLRVLGQRGGRHVYYAITGPQPTDARGMPEDVQRQYESQKLAEQCEREEEAQHQRHLRHARELEIQSQQIDQQRHKLRMAQDSERAQNQRSETMKSARLGMALENEAALQQRAIAEYDRSAELTHRRNFADQETTTLENKNRLQIDHVQKLALTEQNSLEAKSKVESRMLMARDSYQERQYNRTLNAVRAITEAAHTVGTSPNHLRGFIEAGEQP